MLSLLLFAVAVAGPAPAPTAPPLTPKQILGTIRSTFRSHRPPPPYVAYTLIRFQKDDHGFPDYVGSYTNHIWCRTVDRAALTRQVFRDTYRGPLRFDRPAFNEPRDPGPPTADVFEPAPLRSHPVEFVPTPEPTESSLHLIGSVTTIGEFDYAVESIATEGDTLHLHVRPTRDPQRNRIRELFVDKNTYELRKLVATDKLFIDGTKEVYGVVFTITMGTVDGHLVVTNAHGIVGDGYAGDGTEVDFKFTNITFPDTLPAWYFDPKQYAGHTKDAPL